MSDAVKATCRLLRQGWRGDVATDLMRNAADLIEAQQRRIGELKAERDHFESEYLDADAIAKVNAMNATDYFTACAERDALREQLAARDAETVRVTAEKAAALGYVVLAKRPDIHRPGEFEYQPAGGVHATIEPCENHQAYCQDSAEADRERYGDVEYVIGHITLAPDEKGGA